MLNHLEEHDDKSTSCIIEHPLKPDQQIDVGLLLEGLYDLNGTTDFKDTYQIFDKMIEYFSLEMKFDGSSEVEFNEYQMQIYYLYNLRNLFGKVANTQVTLDQRAIGEARVEKNIQISLNEVLKLMMQGERDDLCALIDLEKLVKAHLAEKESNQ